MYYCDTSRVWFDLPQSNCSENRIVLRLKSSERFFILGQNTEHLNPYLGLIQVWSGLEDGLINTGLLSHSTCHSCARKVYKWLRLKLMHTLWFFPIRFLQAVKTGTFSVQVWWSCRDMCKPGPGPCVRSYACHHEMCAAFVTQARTALLNWL